MRLGTSRSFGFVGWLHGRPWHYIIPLELIVVVLVFVLPSNGLGWKSIAFWWIAWMVQVFVWGLWRRPRRVQATVVIHAAGAFSVTLLARGQRSMDVISTIRKLTGATLDEALKIVNHAPSVVLDDISEKTAMTVKAELEDNGATVIVASSATAESA